jgi:cytochrome b
MAANLSNRLQHSLLKAWHAWLAGGFLVAWLTADEDTYAMHVFAGYAVLAAIAIRLAASFVAPPSSAWRLPRPSIGTAIAWLSARKGRHPLFAWLSAALLAAVGLAAVTGAFADGTSWLEHPHEAIAEAALWVIAGHIAFVAFIYGGRRLLGRVTAWLGGGPRPAFPRENGR